MLLISICPLVLMNVQCCIDRVNKGKEQDNVLILVKELMDKHCVLSLSKQIVKHNCKLFFVCKS